MNTNTNHVRMEKNQCPVCLVIHEHNTGIIIHKQLKDIPEDQTCTGMGMCQKHDALEKDDYIALIVIENTPDSKTKIKLEDAKRTGEIVHLKRNVFNASINIKLNPEQAIVFIDKQTYDMILNAYSQEPNTRH